MTRKPGPHSRVARLEKQMEEGAKMNSEKIRALLSAVDDIVRENEPFRDKVQAIKEACDDDERGNLAEFLSWWDDELDE